MLWQGEKMLQLLLLTFVCVQKIQHNSPEEARVASSKEVKGPEEGLCVMAQTVHIHVWTCITHTP